MAAPNTKDGTCLNDLRALLQSGEGADVTLVVGSSQLLAHSLILTARSPVFAAMFRNNMKEARTRRIEMTDIKEPVLRQLLHFMYTDTAPQVASIAAELLAAADKYDLPLLKKMCEEKMVQGLNFNNVTATAVLAVTFSCTVLKSAAVDFIARHPDVMISGSWVNVLRDNPAAAAQICSLVAAATPKIRSLPAENKGQRLIEMAKKGAVDEVRQLLAAGANVAARDDCGSTALHCAALGGHDRAVRVLLEHGAEVDAKDNNLDTPLNLAAWKGHTLAVRLLLAFKANPNNRDHQGRYPLHWAAEKHFSGIVTELLAAGADKRVTNYSGLTPLDAVSNDCKRYCLKCTKDMLK